LTILHKKLFRNLLLTPGQSLAVVAVVLCGTACYICIASAYRNLLLTRDTYYTQHRFADFEVHLERAPMTAVGRVEEIAGVRRARGRIVKDVKVDVEGVEISPVGRIISMPEKRAPVLNDIVLQAGRYFREGALDEVIVSPRFAAANGIEIGDFIDVSVASRKYALRVVGFGLSPEYVYMIRTVQDLVPDAGRFGPLWVPRKFAEVAFDMREACNNIIGALDDQDQVDRVLGEAEDLLQPYGVFAKTPRANQISNHFLSLEIQGLGVSVKIIPAVFQGIAALILLVLLNRMVRTERTQIGLMKAYGYSNWQVAWHYLQFALVLSALGCLGAFGVGQYFAYWMIQIYVDLYQFPLLEARVYPAVLVIAMGIAIASGLLGAAMAAVRAARIHPAESMRPEAPRYAHSVWIERWTALWTRLTFVQKMIVRNISRNAFRAGLNAFGVMVSTGILIVGFFTIDALHYGLHFQFFELQRQDMKVSFQLERDKSTLHDMLRFDHVRRAEPVLEYPFEIRNGWRKKDVVIIGLARGTELQRLVTADGGVVEVGGNGLILEEYLAQQLGLRVGDTAVLKPLMGRVEKEREVVVARIVRQFLGIAAFMDIETLSRLLNEPFIMNAALLRTDQDKQEDVNRELRDVAGIASVNVRVEAYQSVLDTLAQSMKILNVVLVLFAGVIAFSVIYNVTAVSLAERQRELASLRVMGMTASEVGRIMYYENFLLGLLGHLAGYPFGLLICRTLIRAYDSDLYRLPFHVENRTFIIVAVLTLSFIGLANLAARHKILSLDLVEVLKERE
jgi:putative ABC transport system permease protein